MIWGVHKPLPAVCILCFHWYDGSLGLGCAVRFKLQNGTWTFLNIIVEYNEFHRTGTSVALSDGILLIGMPKTAQERGKVMVFTNPYRDVYDEDPNMKVNFEGGMAAHNGQFVVTCTKYKAFGPIFCGMAEP